MGEDRIIEEACSSVSSFVHYYLSEAPDFMAVDNPIEKLWLMAYYMYASGPLKQSLLVHTYFSNKIEPFVEPTEDSQTHLGLQVVLFENWPIDFVICSQSNGKKLRIAIECDGHDFHERTKEQAARDRSRDRELQRMGYRIYRFTGSEIFRDPMKCAREVHGEVVSFGEETA